MNNKTGDPLLSVHTEKGWHWLKASGKQNKISKKSKTFFLKRAKIWPWASNMFSLCTFTKPFGQISFRSDQMNRVPQACKQTNCNICIFRTHQLSSALLWVTVISFTWRYLSYSSKFSQLDTFHKAQHSSNIRPSSPHISSPAATWLTFLHTAIVPPPLLTFGSDERSGFRGPCFMVFVQLLRNLLRTATHVRPRWAVDKSIKSCASRPSAMKTI